MFGAFFVKLCLCPCCDVMSKSELCPINVRTCCQSPSTTIFLQRFMKWGKGKGKAGSALVAKTACVHCTGSSSGVIF